VVPPSTRISVNQRKSAVFLSHPHQRQSAQISGSPLQRKSAVPLSTRISVNQ